MDKLNAFILKSKKIDDLVKMHDNLMAHWLETHITDGETNADFDRSIRELMDIVETAIYKEKTELRKLGVCKID